LEGVFVHPSRRVVVEVVDAVEVVDTFEDVEVIEVIKVVEVVEVIALVAVGLHEQAELYRAVAVPQPPVARVGKPVVSVLTLVV